VTGTTTNLSVLGGNAGGSESDLIYTWATLGTPPADVAFSKNGRNDAKNTVATFTKAGAYTFVVDIYNGQTSATSSVNVTVNATLSSITSRRRASRSPRARRSSSRRPRATSSAT
jgi:hypothetical protein